MKMTSKKSNNATNGNHGGRKANAAELVMWAKRYIKRDWKVFLTAPGTKEPFMGSHGYKDATDDIDEIRRLAKKQPDANLAIATGRVSGCFVVDVDLYKPGSRELLAEFERTHGSLPQTLTAITARGGEHYIFNCQKECPTWTAKLGVGLDVRGDKGYALVEPSMFKGKKYRWKNGPKNRVTIPAGSLKALQEASKLLGFDHAQSNAPILQGARNGTLFNWACELKRKHKNEDEVLAQIREWNRDRCKPPLDDSEVVGIVHRAFKSSNAVTTLAVPTPRPVRQTKTLADISKLKLKPLVWALYNILPAGVALLAGAPKIGKSLIGLQMGLAISVCKPLWKGRKPETRGEVLYMTYEDNDRRIRKRARQLLHGAPLPKRFHVDYNWPRMDQGGMEDLDNWLRAHRDTRLVIIDTLARFRPESTTKRTAYDYDYATGSALAPIAERHRVAIVLVHHTAKAKRPDIVDSINSTNGLPAGVDTIMVLGRERGTCDGSLFINGRDVKERNWAMKKDDKLGWFAIGNLDDVLRSPERKALLAALKAHGPKKPKELAAIVGKPDVAVRQLLMKMVGDGEVTCVNGIYSV